MSLGKLIVNNKTYLINTDVSLLNKNISFLISGFLFSNKKKIIKDINIKTNKNIKI